MNIVLIYGKYSGLSIHLAFAYVSSMFNKTGCPFFTIKKSLLSPTDVFTKQASHMGNLVWLCAHISMSE